MDRADGLCGWVYVSSVELVLFSMSMSMRWVDKIVIM
jgi:hypothetical protein